LHNKPNKHNKQLWQIRYLHIYFMVYLCIFLKQVAIRQVCTLFLGWDPNLTISIGVVSIVYSKITGVSSVTVRNIFQFIIFIAAISVICNITVSEVGGLKKFFNHLQKN
jgi:Na+/proline symporter